MLDVSAIALTDKRIVVTGAGRGLGEAIAVNMARFGAHIAILDLDASWAATRSRCAPM